MKDNVGCGKTEVGRKNDNGETGVSQYLKFYEGNNRSFGRYTI